MLGEWGKIPVTYAGGVGSFERVLQGSFNSVQGAGRSTAAAFCHRFGRLCESRPNAGSGRKENDHSAFFRRKVQLEKPAALKPAEALKAAPAEDKSEVFSKQVTPQV